MASTVWKGYISFGLISVPVRLYVAAREEHVSFHQIHQVCGTRIKQQLFCPTCERVVERNELAKGYPVDRDHHVLVTNEELKSLEAESSQTMQIVQFVKIADVDPIYYQTSYYSAAEEPGRRAYALIFEGMKHLGLGAIAKITLHQREQIVMIRPFHEGLALHTLYYPEEVREIPEFGDQGKLELQKSEVELAEQFMKQLTQPFHPEQFHDEYEARVEELVASKEAGAAPPAEVPKRHLAPVINLMDALKKSMEQQKAAGKPSKQPETATEEATPPKKAPQRAASGARRKKAS